MKLLPNTLLEKQLMSENSLLIPNNFQAAEQGLIIHYLHKTPSDFSSDQSEVSGCWFISRHASIEAAKKIYLVGSKESCYCCWSGL
jgi:hypothetical protein